MVLKVCRKLNWKKCLFQIIFLKDTTTNEQLILRQKVTNTNKKQTHQTSYFTFFLWFKGP